MATRNHHPQVKSNKFLAFVLRARVEKTKWMKELVREDVAQDAAVDALVAGTSADVVHVRHVSHAIIGSIGLMRLWMSCTL